MWEEPKRNEMSLVTNFTKKVGLKSCRGDREYNNHYYTIRLILGQHSI